MLEQTIIEAIKPQMIQALNDHLAEQGVALRTVQVVVNKKVVRETSGLFHKDFEKVLKLVNCDIPTMLVGPAGSGKNVCIKQVADALGLEMYYTNNVSNEFKVTGFVDAGGVYHETEFYKAFKNGGVFFLDEIDSSDPSALIILNSAISNGYVTFPHEKVERHPDFRCIAAANTWGNGRDFQYVGRNALDAASLDRIRASAAAVRVNEVLDTEPGILDPKEEAACAIQHGHVEFRNVGFRYHGAEQSALRNISFEAKPGEVTAIIGSTGSGKSTIVRLIPRFFDVTDGAILLDGVDIREIKQKDLRDQIGYTPQRGILFSGTIASNLQLAKPDATEEEMEKVLEIAQASDFVQADPAGLNREIAQNGANVSGGQKQRLSIARVLLKNPPVFIFDDSFSALDFKTDAALRRALSENVRNSTILIVTQRVATAKNSDQILVLEHGLLVGAGTHAQLMRDCQTYQEIANSQLSKEELE